ncbi:hypothetical protein O6H91_09G074700 [Diphasiastrum complanatum]|uniref:Uncharacterized protein n=1 Tax=Diphasiastrum complanatum TaxID=34168 RepID=A0ACC2CQT3_DIPCM|nr:hypothetical protein O6H91_09G074700 [Diphasiastrum complanatum]
MRGEVEDPMSNGAGSPSRGGAVTINGETNTTAPNRYEAQKRRDWNTFKQFLKNHRPPLELASCGATHVLVFLRYLDQFGKTKVHLPACPFFGLSQPSDPCTCPLRQAWGSLDALIGRLRAAFEEHVGKPESNPFGAWAVRLYLREVRELQAKARGIPYEKKRKRSSALIPPPSEIVSSNPLQILNEKVSIEVEHYLDTSHLMTKEENTKTFF